MVQLNRVSFAALSLLLAQACAPAEEAELTAAAVEEAAQPLTGPIRLMAVGDSITQGHEGDFTWRYRLWQHLRAHNLDPQFVGPWTGTARLMPPASGERAPSHDGEYRKGIDFPQKANMAEWGWMMGEAKWAIAEQVKAHRPDVLLIELGFNDIAWNLSDTPPAQIADGVLASLTQLVNNARLAAPNIKILVADVPQRTPIESYAILPEKIRAYNSKLDGTIRDLFKSESPIYRVYFDRDFNEYTDAYDGLHPNVRGEYVIAKAFAEQLASRFNIGRAMSLPTSMPPDQTPGPTTWLEMTAHADYTATFRWSHVFGATGYKIWTRDLTNGETSFRPLPFPIGADGWRPTTLPANHVIEYKLETMHGDYSGGFSASRTLTTPKLPVVTMWTRTAGKYSATLVWEPVPGADDYHIYAGGGCRDPQVSGQVPQTLIQWSLGDRNSFTHENIFEECMNYVVVASRNGGEGPRPAYATQIFPINTSMFNTLEQWLIEEMGRNMNSEIVRYIREVNQQAADSLNPIDKAAHKAAALKLFADLVCTGCAWDHKPMLRAFLENGRPHWMGTRIEGREHLAIYYDIWSNIHFAFVGRVAGFSVPELEAGAAAPWNGGWDTADHIVQGIGYSLFNEFGSSTRPTKAALHREIDRRVPELYDLDDCDTAPKPFGTCHVLSWSPGMH